MGVKNTLPAGREAPRASQYRKEKRRAIAANNARIRELAKRVVERDEEARKARAPVGRARSDERGGLLKAIQVGLP